MSCANCTDMGWPQQESFFQDVWLLFLVITLKLSLELHKKI